MSADGIRAASVADVAVLAALHRASFPSLEVWSAELIGPILLSPTGFGLIHPAGAMLLGRVAVDEAEILTLAVVPGARRRGLARALLLSAMAQAAAAGAVSMVLEVGITNQAARRLYDAAGFVAVGLRRLYYRDGSDAVVMRAALGEG